MSNEFPQRGPFKITGNLWCLFGNFGKCRRIRPLEVHTNCYSRVVFPNINHTPCRFEWRFSSDVSKHFSTLNVSVNFLFKCQVHSDVMILKKLGYFFKLQTNIRFGIAWHIQRNIWYSLKRGLKKSFKRRFCGNSWLLAIQYCMWMLAVTVMVQRLIA